MKIKLNWNGFRSNLEGAICILVNIKYIYIYIFFWVKSVRVILVLANSMSKFQMYLHWLPCNLFIQVVIIWVIKEEELIKEVQVVVVMIFNWMNFEVSSEWIKIEPHRSLLDTSSIEQTAHENFIIVFQFKSSHSTLDLYSL